MRFVSLSSLSRLTLSPPRITPAILSARRTMLDINLFRVEKGGDPDLIRDSQRRRFKDASVVDEIINLDKQWRQLEFELSDLRRDFNKITKEIKQLKLSGNDASEKIKSTDDNKKLVAKKEVEAQKVKAELDAKLATVGNIVHDSVPVSNNEDDNEIIQTWGERHEEPNLKNHVELVERLGIVEFKKTANVMGSRGFLLIGNGDVLYDALKAFGRSFLAKRNYTPVRTQSAMLQNVMKKCAQLAQFDEELYKVEGGKYLIATAEQPLCAYHQDEWLQPSELPLRYVGYSRCHRKEAGSHGRDTTGLFRVHEFGKVEQFCVTSPNDNESWTMFEEMIKNAEDILKALNIPYRCVAIVSGALNDAAAKKFDLEAWFPASKTYREVVSCSNCTDYQARSVEARYGHRTNKNEQTKQYVHMLNCTAIAIERMMCCILENYQKEDGVEIPPALHPYMADGITFLPFQASPSTDLKKSQA